MIEPMDQRGPGPFRVAAEQSALRHLLETVAQLAIGVDVDTGAPRGRFLDERLQHGRRIAGFERPWMIEEMRLVEQFEPCPRAHGQPRHGEGDALANIGTEEADVLTIVRSPGVNV